MKFRARNVWQETSRWYTMSAGKLLYHASLRINMIMMGTNKAIEDIRPTTSYQFIRVSFFFRIGSSWSLIGLD
jgi:hypothetical protein